jgi:hypothetical protein
MVAKLKMTNFRFWLIAFVAATLTFLHSCHMLPKLMSEKPIIAVSQAEQDVAYLTALGLMKGHLIVAGELLEQGTPDQAEPHLGHPVEELYADIEEPLRSHNSPPFKTTLEEVHTLAKYKPADPRIQAGYGEVLAAIDQAIETVLKQTPQSPEQSLQVLGEILNAVDAEYAAGIANNRIVARIEYQDSRGFVLYCEKLYRTIAPQIKKKDSAAAQELDASFAHLKKAFPSVNPPPQPVLQPQQVSQLIKEIQKIKG